jgi:apolipoprotein N-acyltransferase
MYGYTKYNIAKANYPTSEIVVVQPNVDPFEKYAHGTDGAVNQVATLVKLSEQAIGPDTKFLLWPETSIPYPIMVDESQVEAEGIIQSLRRWLVKYPKVQLIAGLNSYKRMPPAPNGKMQEPIYYNTGLHLTAFGPATLYHKSKLVPGVEQMPYPELLNMLGSLAIDLGGTVGSLGKQDQRSVFYDTSLEANSKVSPVICYESIYSDFVGGFARNGSTSIGVITNDAWWGNTPGHQQHFAYGKLRAIESRQMISRAANTGISGFIDEVGDVLQASKYDTQTVMKANVRQHKSDTFYVRFGNWVPWVALFGLIVTIWLSFNHKASN